MGPLTFNFEHEFALRCDEFYNVQRRYSNQAAGCCVGFESRQRQEIIFSKAS